MKDMEINEKIRYFRKQRKLSQELLAERTGINVNTIRKYEMGIRKPKVEQLKRIEVQTTDGTVYLLLSDIYYIEVIRHYLIYHTSIGEFRSRGTMKSAEEMLSEYHFCRSNNCYLINLKYVQAVRDSQVIVAGETLQMSRGRKNEFISQLSKYF